MDTSSGSPRHWAGALPADGVEIVAGLVIETMPGRAPAVAIRLARQEGLELVGGDGSQRIAAVWTAESGKSLVKKAEDLLAEDDEILGLFPTFMGRADEAGA
ncbi:MAG: hypothetical protein Q9Q40_09525 [Acidobacteriota bacterium]|nr:hypothetical protein [Acidobacteriota bacterium]MDQ7087053.1 hypothetical protein [Acidobacteriota bacterium]